MAAIGIKDAGEEDGGSGEKERRPEGRKEGNPTVTSRPGWVGSRHSAEGPGEPQSLNLDFKSPKRFQRSRAAERRSGERVSREMESWGFLHAISRKYHGNNQVKAAVGVCFSSTRR